MTMTLTEFLLARITEDEAGAQQWFESVRAHGGIIDDTYGHFGPSRVLAECEAKRRIVQNVCVLMAHRDMYAQDKKYLLCLLALPYADHPDYLPEWRP